MARWIEGTVVEHQQWTGRLHSLRIEADVEPFQPGQVTRLALDIDGVRVGRPYSFVNPPAMRPLDFYFITVADGPLSNAMVKLGRGGGIYIAPRAAGVFTLERVMAGEDLWLLSTGTALGPFLSMLRTDAPWQRFARIVLVHAVRQRQELTYTDVIESLVSRYPRQFQMIPFVSREVVDFALEGRVPDAVTDGRLESRAGFTLAPARSRVMICGNPDMVRDTTAVLEARGFMRNLRQQPGQISTEDYWK